MKLIVKIDSADVLLTAEQAESLVGLLKDCERLVDKHVDKDKGTHGYNMSYIHNIEPFDCTQTISLKAMDTERYEAIKLVTKLGKGE